MPRYDVETVKSAAAGRWPELFYSVSMADMGTFDGSHRPCPMCGGKDRFRLIDRGDGACICNQCLTEKNGDGLAVVQWLTGKGFAESLATAADFFNVKPEAKKRKVDPGEHLDMLPWNVTQAGLWCLKKPPIKSHAIQAIGGRIARYRDQYTVIAIPIWGPAIREEDCVGWVLYRADGGKLPKWSSGRKEPEWTKVKITAGSQPGVIAPAEISDGIIIKTEGPTDLLAWISDPVDGCGWAFTTANGATEKPLEWIVELCKGKQVAVLHDADQPGQDGATWVSQRDGRRPGWCPRLAATAEWVKNLTLPFAVERTSGPDLRDYLNGGGKREELIEKLSEIGSFEGGEEEVANYIDEAVDDPCRLARINLKNYQSSHGGTLVYWKDEWWKWKEGVYRKIELQELKAKVWASVRSEFESSWREGKKDAPIKKVSRSLVSNVVGAMEAECAIPSSISMPCWLPDRTQPNYLSAKNGILDLDMVFSGKPREECLLKHSPEWFSSLRVDYEFDEKAECPRWIEYITLSMEGDQERVNLLQEWAGYMLTASNDLQKFLVLEGGGGNGKTVFFAGIMAMIGEDNVSHVTIENFGGRFELGTTIGKAVNISPDAGVVDSIAEGVLKQFTGGDVMQFDRKNLSPISARPTAKLLCAWNERPTIKDRSMGLWRRMTLIPFRVEVPEEHKVVGMDGPSWWIESGEAPGILNWAIVGLARLKKQGGFSRSRSVIAAMSEYREDSNPASEFLRDYLIASEGGMVECGRLYELYQHWCKKTGGKPLGNRKFGKELRREFTSVDRIRKRNGANLEWSYTGINFSTEEIFGVDVDRGSLF